MTRSRWMSRETPMIRELLLEQVGVRPREAATLFERARDQLGQVGERRLWRALAWLVARGQVRVVGHKHQRAGYQLAGSTRA